jgi:hypothetical protein
MEFSFGSISKTTGIGVGCIVVGSCLMVDSVLTVGSFVVGFSSVNGEEAFFNRSFYFYLFTFYNFIYLDRKSVV